MKNLLFIIILICIAVSGYAQQYSYSKVMFKYTGSDYFAMDHCEVKNQSGNITIGRDNICIDGKKYKIKKKLKDNIYRAKGGMIEYIYNRNEIASVHILKYSTDIYYKLNLAEDNNMLTQNTQ